MIGFTIPNDAQEAAHFFRRLQHAARCWDAWTRQDERRYKIKQKRKRRKHRIAQRRKRRA